MLLTCPACDTQYKIEDEAISPEGSRVRCFRCSYTWTAKRPQGGQAGQAGPKPEEDRTQAQEPASKPAPEPAPEPEPVKAEPREKPADETPKPQASSGKDGADDESLRAALDPVPQAEEAALRDRASTALYLIVLLLFITLSVLLWTKRDVLSTAHPLLRDAYRFIGYDAVLPGEGLQLASIRSLSRSLGERRELTVEGEVVNVSGEEKAMPGLRFQLIDGEGEVLDSWIELLPEPSLQPEERALFSITRENPPEGAVDIAIAFVPRPEE